MNSQIWRAGSTGLLFVMLGIMSGPTGAQSNPSPSSAQAAPSSQSAPVFKKEQLDQLLAPIALYPDALLSQILMATTYPSDVAEAAAWSKAHPKSQGDEAVKEVANQPWDPSVQSLVAFPQVLAQFSQQPDWVQNVGDAFLAQPKDVMDSVQRLRAQAQKAGNLKSNDQQKVVVQQSTPDTTVIEIQPTNPQVVYVPSYNPTVVYGSWAYPSYPPPYWPPPPGYAYPVMSGLAAGLAFGAGIAITNSLWGGCNWGGGDVDINVNRYNNINTNNRISGNGNRNGNVGWNHNAENRRGTPYRDSGSRQKYSPGVGGADQRQAYRGRTDSRDAQRQNAFNDFNRSTGGGAASNLRQNQGAGRDNVASRDRAGAGNRQGSQGIGGDRGNTANRGGNRAGTADRGGDFGNRGGGDFNRGGQAGNRQASSNRGSAFSGVQQPSASRSQMQRGQSSQQSFRSQRPSSSGRQVSRPSPSRGGGGGRGRR
ncbi:MULTISPECIES: DUF3300 domain-containing protein [Dyella]|uniref:DUF3300 domain-containing protein n=2 Tax=Dyella TaxID=231454 RepID=A0A4R0Z3G1_9GAMM|nr:MULTISPECIES: DUF3300 domain-containing protein [Dyella]TBR39525.1 DUF3300 domain-containing protein [Dyella terrae]TCI12890.1 DUF3300 domain-containing protein [Dyella soli]